MQSKVYRLIFEIPDTRPIETKRLKDTISH